MYNDTLKNRFIDEHYNKASKKSVISAFKKYGKIEKQFDTDLYDFNFHQRNELLMSLSSSSLKAIRKDYNFIQNYVKWYEKQSGTYNMAFQDLTTEQLKQYIAKAKKEQYIYDRNELYNEVLPKILNPVDKAMIVLLYEGVLGEGSSDLFNFKKQDIRFDEKRFVFKMSDGTPRTISNIDERSLKILQDAIDQRIYELENGECTAKAPVRDLVTSDYIVRPIIGFGDKINKNGVITKMSKIKVWTGKRYIKSKSVHYSGMFDKLRSIELEEKRDLTTEDYQDALIAYGYNPNQSAHLKSDYTYFREE